MLFCWVWLWHNLKWIKRYSGSTVYIYLSNLVEDIILDAERELDQKEANRKHKMMINQTVSIGILKNDLIYILLETDGQKKNMLFQQIYEDISKNLVPIRPDRHYTRTKGQLAGKYSNTHKRAYWAKKYEYKEKGISMPIYKQKAGIIVL